MTCHIYIYLTFYKRFFLGDNTALQVQGFKCMSVTLLLFTTHCFTSHILWVSFSLCYSTQCNTYLWNVYSVFQLQVLYIIYSINTSINWCTGFKLLSHARQIHRKPFMRVILALKDIRFPHYIIAFIFGGGVRQSCAAIKSAMTHTKGFTGNDSCKSCWLQRYRRCLRSNEFCTYITPNLSSNV